MASTTADVSAFVSASSTMYGGKIDEPSERAHPDAEIDEQRLDHAHVDGVTHLHDADRAEHPNVGDAG